MLEKVYHSFANRFLSRWLVLAVDLAIVALAFFVAAFFRFEFRLSYFQPELFKYHLTLIVGINLICFLYYKSYTGIVRHTNIGDAYIILKAVLTATVFTVLIGQYGSKLAQIPISLIAIHAFISLFFLVFVRLLVKSTYETLFRKTKGIKEVVIYGSGDLGIKVAKALAAATAYEYKILYFLDENPSSIGKSLENTPVISPKLFLEKLDNMDTQNLEVVMAINNLNPNKKAQIANDFLQKGIVIKSVPRIDDLLSTEINVRQIQNINIEDLLERDPIEIHNDVIGRVLKERSILVTGAAGSIGSEIARQLLNYDFKKLILIDQNESGLYDFAAEIKHILGDHFKEIIVEVADITDESVIKRIFADHRPSYVFHCAAYKHVPLMEQNPFYAVKVNIFGTKLLVDMAVAHGTKRFVMISTDKAVNPTNVMGASKRIAEMYVQSISKEGGTEFITTRFGNVLGSNGSVVPLFKRQIAQGGPITVTDPAITRYFMTIPEACQLVLEAGTMGNAQEIYVFDMGQPVKILDLAKKMIKLAGLKEGKDIQIVFSGLREGEKLYEELLASEENTVITYHPKILIAKVRKESPLLLAKNLKELKDAMNNGSNMAIVAKMKQLVPEYKSNNSEYEFLDVD